MGFPREVLWLFMCASAPRSLLQVILCQEVLVFQKAPIYSGGYSHSGGYCCISRLISSIPDIAAASAEYVRAMVES